MFNVANPQLNLQFKPTWILSCRFMDLCATLALCVFFSSLVQKHWILFYVTLKLS